ncbi:MAG: S46 family peptidase [Bacteroidetes bacterium]|nr:MAG: S46 family peptidase [Bacteroidota bacterium]
MIKKILGLSLGFLLLSSSSLEEGMFPLSEISKIDLKEAGLKIPVERLFNPQGTSLVQALVRVGGCTGSFVSEEGLIVTNHHCAFGAVAAASDPEHDYITKGFFAESKEMEISTSITARITESYADVSAQVLMGLDKVDDKAMKSEMLAANIRKIEAEEREKNPGLLIEISEMLQGKIYTLFRYRQLNDIRLVYVPPRSIGEFGGESDNWVWPRHTGDFSFMRAYVAADGSAASYSKENVPYKPKEHLQINPNGVKENDFVFILGYPGRTYRNQPAQFLNYQKEHQMPFISNWYDYQIETMLELGKTDKEREIKFASRIKRLANTTKNYKGKLQGLNRTDIMANRRADDAAMKAMVENNPKLQADYGSLFSDIDRVYADKISVAERDLWLGQAFASSGIFYAAGFVGDLKNTYDTLQKADKEAFLASLKDQENRLARGYTIYDLELERILITRLLEMGVAMPSAQRPASLNLFASAKNPQEAIKQYVDRIFAKSVFADKKKALELFKTKPEKLFKSNDPFMVLAGSLWNDMRKSQEAEKARQDELNTLLPKMVDLRLLYKQGQFLPDANSTLRFTYGYIRGYQPVDGEIHKPFTSIKGILEKASNSGDYFLEEFIQKLLASADMEAVVCFLYNLDTTGGNSGSPIMDAEGKLVGVNFDRAYTATINDFAWNEEYSRSIGVDIRYVLLILDRLAKADNLLKEMKVK